MYTTKDLVEFGKSIGDTKPYLPYCISTVNDALSNGILEYIGNLIKDTPLVQGNTKSASSWAEKLVNFWPELRNDNFERFAKMSHEDLHHSDIGKAFNDRITDLVATSKALNEKLKENTEITKVLDTMFGGQNDDIFPPESDTDVTSEFIFLYDDLTHEVKGEHTTVDDIEFGKQLARVGLTDPKIVNTFLSLSKNIFKKDSKYRRYDMETEAFREAFPDALREEQEE